MRTYTFKLYSSKRNKILHRKISVAGNIYNHLIALHRRYYRLFGKYIPVNKIQLHVTKLKRLEKHTFWKEVGSQAIQDIAQRIDRSYKLFFLNVKKKRKSSPPRFRKTRDYASVTLKQTGYRFGDGNKVVIMGREYKYSRSRTIEGNVRTVTVKRNALNEIFLHVVTDREHEDNLIARTGNIAGFDFGLSMFLTGSDGTTVPSPVYFHKALERTRKLSKQLSKKQKGSNNRRKAKEDLYRQYRKIHDKRMDFHHKTARDFACRYDVIYVEDLSLTGMARLWGRKISDLGHGNFLRILQHHCDKQLKKLVFIDRFFPSSKTCSACGHVLDNLPLKIRSWTCPECSVTHDRDFNAAKNILRVGTSTLSRENVRLDSSSDSC